MVIYEHRKNILLL